MTLDASLLRSSFESVIEHEPRLTEKFYDRLFADCPELAPLFRDSDRKAQEKMLGSALVAVLEHLEDASWLERELGALGQRHSGYGVTTAMYDQVGSCLLTTLAHAAGNQWTSAHESEWTRAYRAIATMMMQGAADSPAGSKETARHD